MITINNHKYTGPFWDLIALILVVIITLFSLMLTLGIFILVGLILTWPFWLVWLLVTN